MLIKSSENSIQKQDYFQRISYIMNEMKNGFKQRPKHTELKHIENKLTNLIADTNQNLKRYFD